MLRESGNPKSIKLLPEVTSSDKTLLDCILRELSTLGVGSEEQQYLQAFCRALGCDTCLFIKDGRTVVDDFGRELSARDRRESVGIYEFLFSQKKALKFTASQSLSEGDAVYVPIDSEFTQTEDVLGILFQGVHTDKKLDQSLTAIFSAIYIISDRFTSKVTEQETKTCIYDSLA